MKRREFLIRSAALTIPYVTGPAVRSFVRTASAQPATGRRRSATGPLRKHAENPRYFADGQGRAILLTGAHTWNNLVDIGESDPPPRFDFDSYLDFLERYDHNFIRLWTWETTNWDTRGASWGGEGGVNRAAPHPWARTGPGEALDGKPKFDLTKYDPEYFRRLRTRVAAAGVRGIYVSIMLFEGWALQFADKAWQGHPMHPANNVNGIASDWQGDHPGVKVYELGNEKITQLQEAYVRHVVDTVNDLDNVLYEISNENHPASTAWQYHLIDYIHQYERQKGNQHPVGMTFQYKGGSNQTLMDSPADWISPNPDGGYRDDPPASDGRKVILTDTDHLWGIGGNAGWVWKSLLRGLNPLFMDPYDGSILGKRFDPQWEPVRLALGYARQLVASVDLDSMQPRGELSSTRYCLARPGHEYIVYLPEGREATIDLADVKSTAKVQWTDPRHNTRQNGPQLTGGGKTVLRSPSPGDALVHIKAATSP